MKKVLLSIIVVLVLLWSCGTVFAKGAGKGKAERGQSKRTERIEKKEKGTQADANEPTSQRKGKQVRQRDRQQGGEVSGEVEGKSKGGKGKQERKLEEKDKGKGKGKAVEKEAGEGVEEGQVVEKDTGKGKGKGKAVEEGAGKGKGKGKVAEKDIGQGKGHQQQLQAVEKQILQEEIKHSRWQARLKRIRELATEEGNTKMVERVDKLLEDEQQRYDRKSALMQERKQKILQLGQKDLSGKAEKAAKKVTDEIKPGSEKQIEEPSEEQSEEQSEEKGVTKESEK